MIRISGVSLLAIFMSASVGDSAPVPSETKNAKDQLAGKWKVNAISYKGRDIDTSDDHDLQGAIFTFDLKDNKCQMRLGPTRKIEYTMTVLDCQIASGKMECQDFVDGGYMPKFRAIYKLEDKTLFLSVVKKYEAEDKTDWPKSYTSKKGHRKAGDAESLFVLKLVREK